MIGDNKESRLKRLSIIKRFVLTRRSEKKNKRKKKTRKQLYTFVGERKTAPCARVCDSESCPCHASPGAFLDSGRRPLKSVLLGNVRHHFCSGSCENSCFVFGVGGTSSGRSSLRHRTFRDGLLDWRGNCCLFG